MLLGLAVIVPGTMVAAAPQPTATKTGRAVATGSTTDVAAGGEVDWTIDLADADDRPVESVITDTIGPGQEFVPGSVRTPPGLGVTYSDQTEGDDFGGAGGTTTRRVRATARVEQPSSLLGAVETVGQNVPTFTQGDGWVPILIGARVFNVYHHTGNNKPEVNCTLRGSGQTCPGYPQEVFVEKPNDLFTPFSAAAFVDASRRLWFSGTRDLPGAQDIGGFVCFDTVANAPCPTRWFPTTQNLETGTAYVARSPFSGVAANGTKIFAMAVHPTSGSAANQIELSCFDTATLTACGNTPMNTTGLPGWENAAYAEGRSPVLQMRQVGDRFFMLIDYGANPGRYAGIGNRLLCADLAAGGPCAGWTVPAVPGTGDGGGLRFSNLLFPDLNDTSKICVGNTFVNLTFFGPVTSRPITCFNSTGGAAAAPAGFQAAVNAVPLDIATFDGPRSFAALAYVTAEVGTRMFIPFSTPVDAPVAGINSWALCFDFATGARCTDFGTGGIGTFPAVNNGRLTLYGFTADDNGCLWGLGDAGWQLSFSASTTSSCSVTSASATVRPQSFYCGPTQPAFSWRRAELISVDTAQVSSVSLDVFGPDGAPVPGFTGLVSPTGVFDLAQLPPGDNGYRFDAKVNVKSTSALSATSRFQVTFNGPPAQICLRTKVAGGCDAPTTVRNDVEVVIDDGSGPVSTNAFAQMNVTTDQNCLTTTTTTSSTSSSSVPPPSSSSTTVPDTSTTVPDTSTSTSTTVPEDPTTTSTTAPPPSVLPSTTINTTTTAPVTPTAPPPAVQGEQVTRGSGGALAFTGSGTAALLTMAVLLLCAGLALMGPRRREN